MMKKTKLLMKAALVFLTAGLLNLPVLARADDVVLHLAWRDGGWKSSLDDGDTWSEGTAAVEENVKDGSKVLIDANGTKKTLEISFNAKLAELAAVGGVETYVTANGVDRAYALADSTLVLRCDADKVVALPGAVNQVNGNVGEVEVIYPETGTVALGVTGSVGKINVYLPNDRSNQKTVYQIQAGKLDIDEDGYLITDAQYYSLEPVSADTAQQSTASQPQTEGKVLDKVPKTGVKGADISLFLFGISGFFFAAGIYSLAMFKKTQKAG